MSADPASAALAGLDVEAIADVVGDIIGDVEAMPTSRKHHVGAAERIVRAVLSQLASRSLAELPPLDVSLSENAIRLATSRAMSLHYSSGGVESLEQYILACSARLPACESALVARDAKIAELTQERDGLRARVEEHNSDCRSSCKARDCGYKKPDGVTLIYSRRCPECPLDYTIDEPESGGDSNANTN